MRVPNFPFWIGRIEAHFLIISLQDYRFWGLIFTSHRQAISRVSKFNVDIYQLIVNDKYKTNVNNRQAQQKGN